MTEQEAKQLKQESANRVSCFEQARQNAWVDLEKAEAALQATRTMQHDLEGQLAKLIKKPEGEKQS